MTYQMLAYQMTIEAALSQFLLVSFAASAVSSLQASVGARGLAQMQPPVEQTRFDVGSKDALQHFEIVCDEIAASERQQMYKRAQWLHINFMSSSGTHRLDIPNLALNESTLSESLTEMNPPFFACARAR